MNGFVSSRVLLSTMCGATAISLAAAHPVGQGTQPRVSAVTALPIAMPFELRHGAVTVEAGIGAGLPMVAVLDTAASDCMVSDAQASRRALQGSGQVVVASAFGQLHATPIGTHNVRLGRVLVEALPLCIGDPLAQWTEKPPDPPVDAWLGTACLSLFTLEIDGRAGEILLGRPDAPPMRGASAFPFSLDQGRALVRALVNGSAELTALVSTGIRGTLVTPAVYRRLDPQTGPERTVKLPAGGTVRVASVRLKELRLGATKIPNVDALAVLDDVPGIGGEIGIIGTDVLLRYRMQVSYSRMQIQLAPSRATGGERERAIGRPTIQQPSRSGLQGQLGRPRL